MKQLTDNLNIWSTPLLNCSARTEFIKSFTQTFILLYITPNKILAKTNFQINVEWIHAEVQTHYLNYH